LLLVEFRQFVQSVIERYQIYAAAPGRCNGFAQRKLVPSVPLRCRDMIRTLVQRIEIGLEVIKIVFRLTPDARNSGPESIVVTLSRV
jgi:hypothetical protein